jgi:2,5-diketo-D-gluconate reductase A
MGFGTWELTDDTPAAIAHALEVGYRMIDTSGDYGTQPGIAEGIKRIGANRDSLFITTKIEETDDAYEATRQNLRELQLEYADLVLIHRPPTTGAGEDLWQGLMLAKQEGLAKDIGVSNYPIEKIQALIDATGEVPVINQIEWSPFGYSEDMLSYANQNNILIEAYSSLTRDTRLDDLLLRDIADKYSKTPAQVLIRWNLQRGTVPLAKANQRQHIEENIRVFDFELSDEDITTLNGLNEHYSALGALPYV